MSKTTSLVPKIFLAPGIYLLLFLVPKMAQSSSWQNKMWWTLFWQILWLLRYHFRLASLCLHRAIALNSVEGLEAEVGERLECNVRQKFLELWSVESPRRVRPQRSQRGPRRWRRRPGGWLSRVQRRIWRRFRRFCECIVQMLEFPTSLVLSTEPFGLFKVRAQQPLVSFLFLSLN